MARRPSNSQLFRFEVFVTSKQLGDALALLTNRVTEVTPPQLVTNAKKTGGRITAATGGTLLEMFAEHLRKTKPAKLQLGDAAAWIEQSGVGNPSSAQYLMKKAVQAKLIRRIGKSKGTGKPIVYAPNAASTAKE